MSDQSALDLEGLLGALRIGVGPVAFLAAYKFFAWLEDLASPRAKAAIAAWLKRIRVPGRLARWPNQVAALFDGVFGDKHWAFMCFWRSCIGSTSTIIILALLWIVVCNGALEELIWTDLYSASILLFAFIICSVVPDYFSLLETRFLITLMQNLRPLGQILLIMLDVPLSMIIFFAIVILEVSILSFVVQILIEWKSIQAVISDLSRVISGDFFVYWLTLNRSKFEMFIPPGLFLYSSLFTSVWLWLYALSSWLVRAAYASAPALKLYKWFFDIDQKPIRAIGAVAGLIVALAWWGIVLITGIGS